MINGLFTQAEICERRISLKTGWIADLSAHNEALLEKGSDTQIEITAIAMEIKETEQLLADLSTELASYPEQKNH